MAAIQRWSKGPTGTVVLLAQEIHRQQVVRVAMMGKDNKLNMLRFEVDREEYVDCYISYIIISLNRLLLNHALKGQGFLWPLLAVIQMW